MKYILLIYGNEAEGAKQSPDQTGTMLQEYGAFTESIRQKGQLVGGERLRPASMASTVQVRHGKTLAVDGPFAETKEQLGGFYIVETKDIDEARGLAARIPGARTGSVEVRPIWVM